MFSFLLRLALIGWIVSIVFKFLKSISKQPREMFNGSSEKEPHHSRTDYTGPIEDADFEEIKRSETR